MEFKGRKYIYHNSRSDVFTIWNLSDLHLLNKACAVDDVKRDIEIIKNDPFSFWVGGGDYAEFIGHDDKRFDPDAVSEDVKVKDLGRLGKYEMEMVRGLFSPIKHKCLGLLFGNHEYKFEIEKKQLDLHGWLCTELSVDNLGYSAMFDLIFVNLKIKIPMLSNKAPAYDKQRGVEAFRFFVHHGAGFASTPGGKLNKLIQAMNSFDAEIFMLGHVHDQTGRRQVTIGADEHCTKSKAKVKLGVISGSYLKTYSDGVTTYGEQRMYLPTTLGAAKISIRPDTRELKAEV
jgi:hypothetical protein